MRTPITGILVIAVATLLVPGVLADPMATVYQLEDGTRCYMFWNDAEPVEYWLESNGVPTGGVPEGNPATGLTGQASGLQRIAHPNWGDADTRLPKATWTSICNPP